MSEHFTRKSQLAGKLEVTAGTVESLAGADVALKPLSDGFGYEPDPQRFENVEVADDIGTAPDFVVAVPGTMNIPITLKNSGVLATAPAIGLYLRACGMKEQKVDDITIDTPSPGGFTLGDAYTSPGKTGFIDSTIAVGGKMRYIHVTGGVLEDTDVVTSGANTANASDASGDIGWKYTPTTESQETLTCQRGVSSTTGTALHDLIQRLRGAMGSFTMEAEALNAVRMIFNMQGVEDFAGYGDIITSPVYEAVAIADVPKFVNATLQINGIEIRVTNVSLTMNNDIVLEPNPATSGGAEGYDFARVSGRSPQITVDPRTIHTLDDHAFLRDGTLFPFRLTFGVSPQQIDIVVTAGQLRELSGGDRSGLHTADKTIFVTRHATLVDHDLAIYFL